MDTDSGAGAVQGPCGDCALQPGAFPQPFPTVANTLLNMASSPACTSSPSSPGLPPSPCPTLSPQLGYCSSRNSWYLWNPPLPKRLGKHGSKGEKSLTYMEMSQPSLLPACHPRQAAFQLFSSKYLPEILSNTLSQPSQRPRPPKA